MNSYILFTTRTCTHCQRSKLLLEELVKNKKIVAQICDAVEHPRAAKRFNIKSVPSLFCENEAGKIDYWIGPKECENHLKELITT